MSIRRVDAMSDSEPDRLIIPSRGRAPAPGGSRSAVRWVAIGAQIALLAFGATWPDGALVGQERAGSPHVVVEVRAGERWIPLPVTHHNSTNTSTGITLSANSFSPDPEAPALNLEPGPVELRILPPGWSRVEVYRRGVPRRMEFDAVPADAAEGVVSLDIPAVSGERWSVQVHSTRPGSESTRSFVFGFADRDPTGSTDPGR